MLRKWGHRVKKRRIEALEKSILHMHAPRILHHTGILTGGSCIGFLHLQRRTRDLETIGCHVRILHELCANRVRRLRQSLRGLCRHVPHPGQEQISDLLEPGNTNLQVREDNTNRGVYVERLSEPTVWSLTEAFQVPNPSASKMRS